jgi:hypothetical protein
MLLLAALPPFTHIPSRRLGTRQSDNCKTPWNPILRRFCPKTLTLVGWVEERNPTFGWLCWVTHCLNPTYDFP